ncbi:restriction endonuclease subunit S [Lactobacillus delbrueckii]|uniref:restriction endonuclease subunit S n=1 Tax=Lactobacillus delbrueckii TaxID=1584 RepID=UPI0022E743B8|nr:restriction endonuclease subunit S [Lactobacillus delbrueckii]
MLVKLKDVTYLVNDRRERRSDDVNHFVSTENLLSDRRGVSFPASTSPKSKYVHAYTKGDILISNIRPYFKKIWKATFDGTRSADVLCFRSSAKELSQDYLYVLLESESFFNYVTKTAKGTKMPRGDKSAILEFEFNLPSLKIQKEISHQIISIEKKIRLNEQINDNLLELINSIYSARQSSDAKKEKIHISDLFDTSSTTYRINEHSNEFVWHFSIPNFDQQRYPTIDSVKDIKSNKIIVKPFSVLVSKLNPTTRRIWAPSTDSFNKYSKVCSTEFVSISGNDITEQATIFAITRSDDFMKYLSSKATGSTNSRQRVKPIDIYSYTLPISKSTLSQIQKQLALLLQKLQSNQDEIITLIKLKQELLFKYF